jgi:hypothetical protein
MKNYSVTLLTSAFISLFTGQGTHAQTNTSKVKSETLNQLVSMKMEMDKEGAFKDRYTIQLFFGGRENASDSKKKYDALKLDWECDLYWESPNLAVRVGKFRNRLEADRALLVVREHFPNAIVMKP